MALRGWRLFGVAGTIFVYLAGILLLSFMSLNGPPQRHQQYGRNGRYDFDSLRHHEVVAKRQPLQWCQALRFFGEADAAAQKQPPSDTTSRPKQTFRGHFVKVRTHKPPSGARAPYHRAPPPAVSFADALPASAAPLLMSISASVVEMPAVRLDAAGAPTKTTTTTTTEAAAAGPHHGKSKYHAGNEVAADAASHKRNAKTAKAHQKSIKQLSDSTERNLIALASFPGSGNTWLRYLLQQATGIFTGSVYKDFGLLKSGFPAENVFNSSVLVVKTHEWGPKSYQHFAKAILLVRDPDKAILAEFNRQSGGHVGFAAPDRYKRTKGRYWQQFVTNKLATWEEMNTQWARNYTGDLLIVYYDDLIADVEGTLRSVLNFIRFPINEDLLACAILRKEGIYRRKKRILTFDPFTPEMHTVLEMRKRHVYSELGRYKF